MAIGVATMTNATAGVVLTLSALECSKRVRNATIAGNANQCNVAITGYPKYAAENIRIHSSRTTYTNQETTPNLFSLVKQFLKEVRKMRIQTLRFTKH